MSFKDFVETEKAQVQTLIDQYKDKIEALEQDLKDWDEKAEQGEPDNTANTPAAIAADPNASSEERAAAANATLGQSPETVNAEQSHPSPSTHDSAKAEAEARYKALHAELNEAAQAEGKDDDKELHEYDSGLPVEGADGREDANKLGEAGQVEDAGAAPGGAQTVDAGTFDQKEKGGPVVDTREEEKDSGADKKIKGDDPAQKQAETTKNKANVATTGKTDDKKAADKKDK